MVRASVIITTHNRPLLLRRAIESARAAGAGVEVVVVDDASVDETAGVCRSVPNIRYVRAERNQRVAGARNLGILASRGEYITFLDDDDVRLAGSLDWQIEMLDAFPHVGLVYGQVLEGDQQCVPTGKFYPASCPQGDIFWTLLEQNFIPCGAAVFRRSCLYRVGLLDEAVPGVDDWDLWLRIAEMFEVRALQQPVAIWRRATPASAQGSSRTVDLLALSTRLLRHKWLKLPRAMESTPRERREIWRRYSANVSEHLAWEFTAAFVSGDLPSANKAGATLLRLHPTSIFELIGNWLSASTLRLFLKNILNREEFVGMKAQLKEVRHGKRP